MVHGCRIADDRREAVAGMGSRMALAEVCHSNEIYELLRTQILSMEITPGQMLSENALSTQMNVGRTQVRDALAQLTEEGYIVVYPQRGTVVAMIDTERVRQAVHAHIVLEQAVIRELCRMKLTEKQFGQLEDTLENQKQKTNRDSVIDFLVAEQRMHYLLSLFCGREHIWEVFRTMDCDLLRVDYLRYCTFNYKIYMSSLTSWEHTQVENRMLLDNIRKGDSEAASLICSNHFSTVLWNTDALRGIYPQYFSG